MPNELLAEIYQALLSARFGLTAIYEPYRPPQVVTAIKDVEAAIRRIQEAEPSVRGGTF